jgi:hypothetical protein
MDPNAGIMWLSHWILSLHGSAPLEAQPCCFMLIPFSFISFTGAIEFSRSTSVQLARLVFVVLFLRNPEFRKRSQLSVEKRLSRIRDVAREPCSLRRTALWQSSRPISGRAIGGRVAQQALEIHVSRYDKNYDTKKYPNSECLLNVRMFGRSIISILTSLSLFCCCSSPTLLIAKSAYSSRKAVLLKDRVHVLHTIGGDDTNTQAAQLFDYMLSQHGEKVIVIGMPKAVDNDFSHSADLWRTHGRLYGSQIFR